MIPTICAISISHIHFLSLLRSNSKFFHSYNLCWISKIESSILAEPENILDLYESVSDINTHVLWWTRLIFGHFSSPHMLWWTQKAHVVWWTQIKIFPFQNLMSFDGPIGSILRHEVYKGFQIFPLSKPHVFWWTQKPHVFWWTLDLMSFGGPKGSIKRHECHLT